MFKYSNNNGCSYHWNTVLFESFTGWMPDFVSTFSLCVSIPATLPNQKAKLIWKEMRFRRWNWMHEKLLLLLSLCVYVRAVIQTCKKIYAMQANNRAHSKTKQNKTRTKTHLLDLPPAGIVSRKSNAFSYRSMNNKCKLNKQYFCISAQTHTHNRPSVCHRQRQ